MKRVALYIFTFLLLLGCDIHEFPVDYDSRISFLLNLDFDTVLPIHDELTYSKGKTVSTKAASDDHVMRYTVKAYPEDTSKENVDTVYTFVFTKSDSSVSEDGVWLKLDEGTYTFRVWADYVDAGSLKDKYYNTEDFSEIKLINNDPHIGSTDYRDAFIGSANVTIASDKENKVTIDMARPMGKYKFISTDLDIFLQTMSEKGMSTDLMDFTVVFEYNLFMPCAFNAHEDVTADSWTGVSFESKMQINDQNELELGHDYIFVNHRGTSLSISVSVYDKNGDRVASTDALDVPIARNKLTVVKGDFLTSKSTGGISISPDYDGDYNIEI